jgi:hypothetical protein
METNLQKTMNNVSCSRPSHVFEPTLPNVRPQIFLQIMKFITIPSIFSRVAFRRLKKDYSGVLSCIFPCHLEAIEGRFTRTEKLVNQIFRFTEMLTPWLVLGSLNDFDEEIEPLFESPEEFGENFHSIRIRESDIEQIPVEMD